jgi:hypothetical protein
MHIEHHNKRYTIPRRETLLAKKKIQNNSIQFHPNFFFFGFLTLKLVIPLSFQNQGSFFWYQSFFLASESGSLQKYAN